MHRTIPAAASRDRHPRRPTILTALLLAPALLCVPAPGALGGTDRLDRSALLAETESGEKVEMPLRGTSVRAEISAFVARVEVEQLFTNPLEAAVEARYIFPLPERAAVDAFEMETGGRTIRGEIRRREDAAAVYEAARGAGHTAALLEQERPNIFTQSVANIMPGKEVRVRLTYVDLLEYEAGGYAFLFPMVVGHRYIPGSRPPDGDEVSKSGPGEPAEQVIDARVVRRAQATARVTDAERIAPAVLRPGYVSSHEVAIEVDIDAGVPIRSLESESHEISVRRSGATKASVRLAPGDRIPNKDFMLRIGVAGEEPEAGLLAHRTGGDGFFALRIQPKAWVSAEEAAPKEILFVVDVSGSMSGPPIEMSKRLMKLALQSLGPRDTFDIVTFSDSPAPLSPSPLPSTPESVRRGIGAVHRIQSDGGTEMLGALRAALDLPHDPARLRLVVLLTDGYVGNDEAILGLARRRGGDARFFSVGIGTSVNHYLLREMADLGRGAYAYVRPDGDAEATIDRLTGWMTRPYLTDLEVDWGSLAVEDVQPRVLPDLYAGQTLTVVGRYLDGGSDTLIVRGRLGGAPWEKQLRVSLPERSASHSALGSTWARERLREMLVRSGGGTRPGIRAQATALALGFHLMSPFTSFVAVDTAEIANLGEHPVLWMQAVPMPELASFAGTFGPGGPEAIAPRPGPQRVEAGGPDRRGVVSGETYGTDGRPVAGAHLELAESTSGRVVRSGFSGPGGEFRFQGLEEGIEYDLLAAHPGFAGLEFGPITADRGEPIVHLLTLRSAEELTERIEIVRAAAAAGPPAAPASTTFSSEFVEGMPILGRSYESLVAARAAVDSDSDGEASVQGARQSGLAWRIEGGNFDSGALEEIEVVTAGAAIEYGRAEGGFAGIVSKPGRRRGGALGGVIGGVPGGVVSESIGGLGDGRPALPPPSRHVTPTEPGEVEVLALRVLADLAEDGRLSRSEGLPALAGLLAAQHQDGGFTYALRSDALAAWALHEAAAAARLLPWVGEAARRAAAALEALLAAREEASGPAWAGALLDAVRFCAPRGEAAGIGNEKSSPGATLRLLLEPLLRSSVPETGHLAERLLAPARSRLICAAP